VFDPPRALPLAAGIVLVRLNVAQRPKILKKIKILLECKTLISSYTGTILLLPLAPDQRCE
jgi:hypothetical protein